MAQLVERRNVKLEVAGSNLALVILFINQLQINTISVTTKPLSMDAVLENIPVGLQAEDITSQLKQNVKD